VPALDTVTFQNGSVNLNAVAAGPLDAPTVILLHGFPEFWYGWHKQIQPLAAAGFRVVVPDQRGYNKSGKPRPLSAYALSEPTRDVIAIANQLKCDRIHLAGHDWGAAVAWSVALQFPNRVGKLAILNVPHPLVMRRHLMTNPRQLHRSWYMFFFQLPWLPEACFAAGDFRLGTSALLNSSRPGTFSPGDLAEYRSAWSQPGSLRAMTNWYRAAFRFPSHFPDRTVRVPTRILWGMRDAFLGAEMAEESLQFCTNAELIRFPDATHWLQHEEPAQVSQILIDFFRAL
jgi:epoxide hydrolase 4